jgi:hypothetical protein
MNLIRTLAIFTIFFSTNLLAAAQPKPIKCPSVVDLEIGEYSRDTNKYKCFSNDKKASANGFLPLSSPTVAAKLSSCLAEKNTASSSLAQCQSDLVQCRNSQTPPTICPPPSTNPAGLISLENIGTLAGAEIWSYDGKTFLGAVSQNNFDQNSIANDFGSYGSSFSSTSIFNDFSPFGSQFDSNSANNSFTSTPPVIWRNGKAEAYLTTNKNLSPRVNTKLLKLWIKYDEL